MAHDKRLTAARANVDRNKNYDLSEAIALAKANAKAKFDETIEIALNLGIDPRHADQMVRGLISLPNGTGKVLRVGVFARGAKAEEALAAGADVVGADDLAEKVQAGDIQFDRCIATPDMMALVGKLGKILGPRGLMPNPKLGTVTMDVKGAVTAARANVDRNKNYDLAEAIALAKSNAKAKFDETIEIALNLGIDPRHADQMVRGLISLPNGTGKVLRVGVFARGAKADEALAAGADVVGADDLAEKVQAGDIQFDRCIATPDMMALVGKLGKILGPRGLMPNPKLGTVTMDVKGAVTAAKSGQVEFRAEKAGIIHAGIGKASFDDVKLVENAKALIDAVQKAKPTGAKGTYLKKVALSTTMGPGIHVDVATVA